MTKACTKLYSNDRVTLYTVPAEDGSGKAYDHHVATTGTSYGGVCLPLAVVRDKLCVGFVYQHRYALDEGTLELPRGGTEDLSLTEASRELVEETGTVFKKYTYLGEVFPDTGILDTRVSAWLATEPLPETLKESWIDDESGGHLVWLPLEDLDRHPVKCAISLATLWLARKQLSEAEATHKRKQELVLP